MISLGIYNYPFQINYDGQIALISLEVLLVFGVIWLIFKKNNNQFDFNLTKSEEERLILAYKPESLAEDVPDTHYALNPRIVRGKVGMYIDIDRMKCLNFGSHNYLGYLGNDRIEDKVNRCIDTYGVGSCGPRGFYGTSVLHLDLENSLAQFLEGEDAIVYSYGFAAISSAIPAYAKKKDIIFVDEKRNFAIQKGLDASRSEIKYFKHNDAEDLEEILMQVRTKDLMKPWKARRSRRYLVIEGIYMNTGEICPLPELVKLSKKYKLRIFIDESVSFGVLGKTGRGVTEYFGIPRRDVDLIMGSFEYALASVGGFCVGSRLLIDHQQISGQGYCFSASLPPLLVTAAAEALSAIQESPEILSKLRESCKIMHYALNCSVIINKCFIISGDQHSPVHVLMLMEDIQDQDTVVGQLLEYCLYKRVAINRAAFLQKIDSTICAANIRITTSIFQTEEHITYLVKVLELACQNVLKIK